MTDKNPETENFFRNNFKTSESSDLSESTATITQSMFCNNCNNDYNRLRLYFIILVILFLLSLLSVSVLHIDRKTIIEQNSKILAEYKHHQNLYNNHIDNSISYIQDLIDLLIKTQKNLSRLKFNISFDPDYIPDVIIPPIPY